MKFDQTTKVLIVGLARTGLSVIKALKPLKVELTINDAKPLEENKDALRLQSEGFRVITGGHPLSLLDENFDFIVKNPGIPYSNPLISEARKRKIPIYTDIELVGQLSHAQIIGITGSNGKTTTTTLLGKILKASHLKGKTEVAGNIGIPALNVALDLKEEDRLVLELSSFQLMGVKTFRPHIAIFLDLYPTHLDYHGSIEAYLEAKWNITRSQEAGDYLILNADQDLLKAKRKETKATIIPLSIEHKELEGAWYDRENEALMFREEKIMDRSLLKLKGDHNVQNALAVIAASKLLGVSNEEIQKEMSIFGGVRHRIQFVDQIQDREFYNDSKATNVEATIIALKSFHTPVVWIAGGLDRHNSIEELKTYLNEVKSMVIMGENHPAFEQLAKDKKIPYVLAENIEEATKKAFEQSQKGDTILLSPASASWDQYESFEVRGDRFISAVEMIKKEQ